MSLERAQEILGNISVVIERCKPYFEEAVKLSHEWDNTSYIVWDSAMEEENPLKLFVYPWSSYKYYKDIATTKTLCSLDGNHIAFYDPDTKKILVQYSETHPSYKSLLGEYIK